MGFIHLLSELWRILNPTPIPGAVYAVMGWDDVLIYVAVMVVSAYISSSMAPTPKGPDPATFKDFEFPQAEEGTPQAVIFGDCWTGDWTVLAVGNYRTTPIRSSGGKK